MARGRVLSAGDRLTEYLPVGRVRPHAVDDGEGELALGQVLTEALAVRILITLEVHVVVSDLKEDRDQVGKRDVVAASRQLRSRLLQLTLSASSTWPS